ncbi:MAG TPA: Ppx/GppA phosphatase family protein [Mycobacteriales bacterium]|nr:Ppx/GppA phosphatase family protein [Mycobacteriales bacterium]
MTRVAAIDCGTNSLRLLIADVVAGSTPELVDVDRRMEIVRLGEGVDRTGQFAPAALHRTFGVLDDYAATIARTGAQRVRMVATSATRDAGNQQDFIDGVVERLGIEPDVVTGAEEAALSFDGATHELPGAAAAAPYLVVDIGGGSTEFIVGDQDGVTAARSVDVGCVRLTERHFRDDPPTAEQVAAAVADVEAALDAVAETVPIDRAKTLIGLAGTVTTVTAIVLDLPEYDAARIHHATVAAGDVHRVTEQLLAATHAERAAMPVMHPGRVDVIAGGAVVLDAVIRRSGAAAMLASEHDILDGIAWSLAG